MITPLLKKLSTKIFLIAGGICLVIVLSVVGMSCERSFRSCSIQLFLRTLSSDAQTKLGNPQSGFKSGKMYIKDVPYSVYIAQTDATRAQGLSGITSMYVNEGVLFVFDSPIQVPFWMKEMKFSLDFIYIRDGKIVDLRQNISPDTYPDLITSDVPFTYVLELNAGQIKQWKFAKGDPVTFD